MKTLHRICLMSALILAAGALAACGSAQQDWNKATAQNTFAAYQQFLNQHPNTEFAAQARSRIQTMEDDQTWVRAQRLNSVGAFRQYLARQPNGSHAAESRARIAAFERADVWKAAEADGKAPALQAFLEKYPQGADSDQARAQLDRLKAEAYRVQVAAFRAQKDANRARDKLQERYRKVLHDVEVVPPVGSEKLTTIRSVPMTLKEAQMACGSLRKEHQHCEVVKG